MKLTRKLLTLSAIAALSFGLAACDDDSDNKPNDPGTANTCTATCTENVLTWCDAEGKPQTKTCNANQTCNASFNENGCVDKGGEEKPEPDCTAPEKKCAGDDSYYTCTAEGKWSAEKTKCSTGLVCVNNECRACIDGERKCVDGDKTKYQVCANNAWGSEQKCPDATTCGGKGICSAEVVILDKDAEGIGSKCSCSGDKCINSITGAELKSAINMDEVDKILDNNVVKSVVCGTCILGVPKDQCECQDKIKPAVHNIWDLIKNDDKILVPNYFFDGVSDVCKNITVPDGMALGCFTDGTIKPPTSFSDILASDDFKWLMDLILNNKTLTGMIEEKSPGVVDKIKEFIAAGGAVDKILNDGIDFKSSEGYCLVANIDLQLDVSREDINLLIMNLNLGKIVDIDKVMAMLNKNLNTPNHDHSKAIDAACPQGSVKLWYTENSRTELAELEIPKSIPMVGGKSVKFDPPKFIGEANVGFDMCLRACEKNDDCRDGYACEALPYGLAVDIAAANECIKLEKECNGGADCKAAVESCKKCQGDNKDSEYCKANSDVDMDKTNIAHVCFDPRNIDYFTNMTATFKPADGTQN